MRGWSLYLRRSLYLAEAPEDGEELPESVFRTADSRYVTVHPSQESLWLLEVQPQLTWPSTASPGTAASALPKSARSTQGSHRNSRTYEVVLRNFSGKRLTLQGDGPRALRRTYGQMLKLQQELAEEEVKGAEVQRKAVEMGCMDEDRCVVYVVVLFSGVLSHPSFLGSEGPPLSACDLSVLPPSRSLDLHRSRCASGGRRRPATSWSLQRPIWCQTPSWASPSTRMPTRPRRCKAL